MKNYKNLEDKVFSFDDDCFDEHGECINEYALKVIEDNNLVPVTKEEVEVIRNYKSPEQIAEEERLAKLPTQEDILNAKIELKALELLSQLELI